MIKWIMAMKLRKSIAEQVKNVLQVEVPSISIDQLSHSFELLKNKDSPELHFHISKMKGPLSKTSETLVKDILHAKYDDRLVKTVDAVEKSPFNKKIIFTLHNQAFFEETLTRNQKPIAMNPKKYVVEYSSPNIAKPFHVGHLRSTIIGNFIANLQMYLGHNVKRINYLGDWGTQFGLLNVGIDLMKLSDEDIQKNPISSLYYAYVEANKRAQTDPSIAERARKYFYDLENQLSPEDRVRWEKYRMYTVSELEIVYKRLGVEFDEFAWESQYGHKDIQRIIDCLTKMNLLLDEKDGRKIVEVGDRRVPVIKSDGSTLYLVRDIAAIADRFERYAFDQTFYVVDNSQTDHFVSLFETAKKAMPELSGRMQHIKFGRIKGMSTRHGTAVFLKDVLDEAKERMKSRQIESPTTKVNIQSTDYISDVLGISAVIINDLKQRRQRDYDFDWDRALQANGDTGIKLQYTHCRLNSLFDNNSINPAEKAQSNFLSEPEAINLIIEIGRFPEILAKCEEQLEACVLVNYLFGLCNTTSRALKRLNIKNEKSTELQEQRTLLFSHAYTILKDGMNILGLQPLEKM